MAQDLAGEISEAAPSEHDASGPAAIAGDVAWRRDSILFSSCNEDTGSELEAFGDLTGKRVLCVTAGGGRVLSLLLARPAEVWAVDFNPAQNYLFELKVAGMRALDHDAYLRFLGVRDATDRRATYARLRGELSSGARRFFDAQPELIESGVLLEGRLERYLRRIARVLQLSHAFGVRRLFAFEDIGEQRAFLGKLDRPLFRLIAETACRRSVLGWFSGDPGFYRYVPEAVPLHRVIYRGVFDHFGHRLARDNPLMQLIFFGHFMNEAALPGYLNAASYDAVKAALENVKLVIITGTVNHALARAGGQAFDALSLSDISSYLDDAAHAQLFRDALAGARPGAKLCSRSNIHHRPLPEELAARLRRDHELEQRLAVTDHSCVHKFVVGEVV